jgi:surfeit locus 1 family protein
VRIFGGVFQPRLIPTLFSLVLVVILLSLGTWQVERLHWKENLIADIATRSQIPPLDIAAVPQDADLSSLEYRKAIVTGQFMHLHEFHVIAISLDGQGGYHILTPFLLDDGRYLLVNRGWVPYDKKTPDTREVGQIADKVTLSGIVRLPHAGWLQPNNNSDTNIWYSQDLSAMAHKMGIEEFMPILLDVDSTPNKGGYPIGGQTRVEIPNNHLGYALTWFGLAIALACIYFISSWKREALLK